MGTVLIGKSFHVKPHFFHLLKSVNAQSYLQNGPEHCRDLSNRV